MYSTIKKIDPIQPVINRNNGVMFDHFRLFILAAQENCLLIGTGSPETVVQAQQGRFYMDENGIAGAILYIKQLADIGGDRTQGWVAIG